MTKFRITYLAQTLILTLSSFTLAQEVAEEVAKKVVDQAEIFKTATAIANEDLSKLKHPLKPMLWKIEGNDLKKASYLFGSVHVADENIITLHPAAEAAYQQADTLATEVSMGLMTQLRGTRKMIRNDGKTLKEAIGEETYAELNTLLADIDPVLSAAPFSKMKTWAVMILHGMIEEQMKGGKPLDLILWERADEDDKKQWALETIDGQMGGFDKLTEAEQLILLKDSISAAKLLKKEKLDSITLLKNLYLKGDAEKLMETLTLLGKLDGMNQEVGEKFEKLILFDRNERMVAKILETFKKMPDKSHFIVAGTMHYLGDNNVSELLRKQGYKITRVEK